MESTTAARKRRSAGSRSFTTTPSVRSTRRSSVSATPLRTAGRLLALSPTEIISTTSGSKKPLSARGCASGSPLRTASVARSTLSTRRGWPAASRAIVIAWIMGMPLARSVPRTRVKRATQMARTSAPYCGTRSSASRTRRCSAGRCQAHHASTAAAASASSMSGQRSTNRSLTPMRNRVAAGSPPFTWNFLNLGTKKISAAMTMPKPTVSRITG